MRIHAVKAIALVATLLCSVATSVAADGAKGKPNILLIVADDMGFSDLGCFGSEIKTPHLDALAARGLRATNFCVGASCSPTRSMLLTGTDNHIAGLGNMAEFLGPTQKGKPGYEGHLNDRVVSVASLMRDAGYHTYMAGKWHLGKSPDQWPAKKGFERDFSLLQGGGSNWSDMLYPDPSNPMLTFTRNGKVVESLPKDYFSSTAYSDFIMECLSEHKADDQPFFAYLAFQAVHAPLAAPDDWLAKYKGQYDVGYEVVRQQRLERMKTMGLVGKDVTAFPRLPNIPAWDTLTKEQRKLSARRMEVYAAMLANMDHHIGRVLDHLNSIGKLDNTLVIFMSDNGPEPVEFDELVEKLFNAEAKKWVAKTFDLRPESWGRPGSVVDYGAAWAQVGSVPFAFFKEYVSEGGIRSSLIVAGPDVKHKGTISPALLHATDLVPTVLELAGAEHPSKKKGSTLAPVTGKSFRPLLTGAAESVRSEKDWLGWEMFGNRAIRQGDWKLLHILKAAGGTGGWQLFNLREDPAELHDVSSQHPEKRAAMLKLWDEYAKTNGVVLTEDGPFAKH